MKVGKVIGVGTPAGYGSMRCRATGLPIDNVARRELLGSTVTTTQGMVGRIVRVDYLAKEVDIMLEDAYRAYFGPRAN